MLLDEQILAYLNMRSFSSSGIKWKVRLLRSEANRSVTGIEPIGKSGSAFESPKKN